MIPLLTMKWFWIFNFEKLDSNGRARTIAWV